MKRSIFVGLACVLIALYAFPNSGDSEPLTIKGSYLGMEKTEVHRLYQKLESEAVARYISLESSEFRDLIQVDYEFSIPEMTFQDMGMVKTWSYIDEARKFSLSIDDYKNITMKAL